MQLPIVSSMPFAHAPDGYLRARQLLHWILIAYCIAVTFVRLEAPCNIEHKFLNSIHQAKAEFQANYLQSSSHQQYWDWPVDTDVCTAKVRDINTWMTTTPAAPPFHFPKIIHQTVEDKYNISCEVLECMQTWKDLNPGYEHRLYDAEDRQQFIRQNYPELLAVYISLSTNVERADLWRYLALHKYGGVYADSDVRCIKPIQQWNAVNNRDADLLVGVVYTDNQGMVTRVNNFIIAAMPCHPVMAAMPFTAMSRIAIAGLQGKPVGGEKGKALSEAVIGRTGPAALTATIAEHAKRVGAAWPVNGTAGAEGAGLGNLVSTVRILPRNIFTMGWETAAEKISCDEALKRNPDAYICHQYFGTWKAMYNHRPSLTYDEQCRYWGLNGTAPARPAAKAVRQQDRVGQALGEMFKSQLSSAASKQQQQQIFHDDADRLGSVLQLPSQQASSQWGDDRPLWEEGDSDIAAVQQFDQDEDDDSPSISDADPGQADDPEIANSSSSVQMTSE